MNTRSLFGDVGKLLLCGIVFSIGIVAGTIVVSALGLQQPPMPEGMDPQSAMLSILAESPLLALVLALLARYLRAGFLTRSLILASLTWISNSLNNQIEAVAFAGMKSGFAFTVVTFLFPALFIGMAVAWLFPAGGARASFASSVREFFSRHSAVQWVWRLALGALLFMPIYYFFGLLVIPMTRSYYQQNMYGLEIPALDQLLTILFIRSVLFLIACLPILIVWQSSKWNLVWRLGLALFYLVGFQPLIAANWMSWSVRLPHMIEILFDEFVYAGALVWLLGIRKASSEQRISSSSNRTASFSSTQMMEK